MTDEERAPGRRRNPREREVPETDGREWTRREYLSLTAAGGLGYAGLGALDATAGGDIVWEHDLDLAVDSSSPTVVDGTVYIGANERTSSLDPDGSLYAVDAATGEREWRFEDPAAVDASPTVLDGRVYFTSNDGVLYALDAAMGEQVWGFTGRDSSFRVSPTIAGGTVYAVEAPPRGESTNVLYAVDARTGEEQWRAEVGERGSAPTVVDGTVYVGTSEGGGFGRLDALDAATGASQFRLPIDGSASDPPPAPTVVDGVAYFGTNDGLFAVDVESGEIEWQFGDVPEGSDWTALTVADGTLYAGQDSSYEEFPSGNVFAVDATTGELTWSLNVDEPVGAVESIIVSSSPTVAGGVVFIGTAGFRDEGGTMYALDGATGEAVWSLDMGSADINSSPTVVDGVVYFGTSGRTLYALDAGVSGSSVDSRVNLGTLGHHHGWQGGRGFRVAVDDGTVAAGLTTELLVELENVESDPVTGLAVEASAGDGATAEIREVPERVDVEETVTAILQVETPRDRTGAVTVELTSEADQFDAFTRTVALETVPPARVGVVPEASDDPVRAGTDQGGTFTFEVAVNDAQAVEDVALVPRFDEVDGDWSVHEPVRNADALRHAGGRWGSADVPERSKLNVWGASELAPGMVEQPGFELTVPEGLRPTEYELPVELRVADADGERFVADETTYTFAVAKRYMSPLLLTPDEPLVDADRVTLEAQLLVSQGSVVNPTLTLDPFPESFEVVDGSDPDGAFLSIENRSVEWGGVFEADTRLSAEFVVELPDGEQAGGSYPVGLTATANVPEIDAERTRTSSTVVTVSDLVGQVAGKRAKADRIDQVVGGVDDRTRVEQRLTAITDAVGAGTLDPVAASQGVERMWLGERLLERSHELTTGVTPTNTVDRGYDLIRPLAEDLASVAVIAGTFGVGSILKLAPSAGRIGGAAIRKAGEWGLRNLRRVIRDLVALGYRARQANRSIPRPLPDDLIDFFSGQVKDYIEGVIGIDELKGQLSELILSRLEGALRGVFEWWTAGELDTLHGALTRAALADGPPGDQVAARGAFATALSGMEFRARRAHQLTGTFNEGVVPIIKGMQGTLTEIYPLVDDPDVGEILELTKQSFDLFITFFTGGAVSMLIGGVAVQTVDAARSLGIERVTDGEDISGSI